MKWYLTLRRRYVEGKSISLLPSKFCKFQKRLLIGINNESLISRNPNLKLWKHAWKGFKAQAYSEVQFVDHTKCCPSGDRIHKKVHSKFPGGFVVGRCMWIELTRITKSMYGTQPNLCLKQEESNCVFGLFSMNIKSMQLGAAFRITWRMRGVLFK